MGFLQPSPPPFDLEEWRARPYLARLKPNAQDWVLHGFGAPGIVYVLYAIKLIALHLRRLDFLSHMGHDRHRIGSMARNRTHGMGHPPDIVHMNHGWIELPHESA